MHTVGSANFAYTVRKGNRDLKVIQYCCWELPDDYSASPTISEAAFAYSSDTLRKLMPVDISMRSGIFRWGGLMALPTEMRWDDKIARLRMDPKLFIDRDIFPAITAAREVSFMHNMEKVKAAANTR